MNNVSLIDLLNEVNNYNSNHNDLEMIIKAYRYAECYHNGQKRESGEDYITHPLNVAYILAKMHADMDTLCAALLHDTLEDTKLTYKEIEIAFNSEIAKLVDGVTNIKDLNFASTEELKYANTRKIITGITTDVRIIIIKLADRLHNMRTLNYKSEIKQKEKSLETMEIYVPFAYYIGAFRIKNELEDLSFKYLKPYEFQAISEQRDDAKRKYRFLVEDMANKIKRILENKNIPYSIRIRTKNIYGLFTKISEGKNITELHDLVSLKIIVDDIDNCYRTLGYIHSLYKPINDKFRDYICSPKTNMYQSLHSTVYSGDRLVQTQIRTFDMDKIASFGLPAFWDIKRANARNEMQKELREKCQFFNSLVEIDSMFSSNEQFVNLVKSELFSDKVYVYTNEGTVIELPKGSTIIDFAYKVDKEEANKMIGALVNDKSVDFDYVLCNKDRVKIITDDLSEGPNYEWANIAQTSYAKKLIREHKTS